MIFDDPIKTSDAMSEAERNGVNHWYRNTFYTRLDDKERDVIIGVMQRVHEDDLVGHILGLDEWTVLSLPAIATENQSVPIGHGKYHMRKEGEVLHPERESYELLMRAKEILGSAQFQAQYLQAPVAGSWTAIPGSFRSTRRACAD